MVYMLCVVLLDCFTLSGPHNMRRAAVTYLSKVSKSNKSQLDQLVFGAHIVTVTGYTIRELQLKACVDRFLLAQSLLKVATRLHASRDYRSATSRAYYAMYHCFRCVVYFVHGGDDHEEHQALPKHIPPDFPNSALWQNELKNARARRNEADYNPYPRTDRTLRADSETLIAKVTELVPMARRYLRAKGCTI
jgi:uncharacterized protein (UPF0332 family)